MSTNKYDKDGNELPSADYSETPMTKVTVEVSEKEYAAIHYWLRINHGVAARCENKECPGTCQKFAWAKLHGKSYEKKRENFHQLCYSCHGRYDSTEETKQKLREMRTGAKSSPETRARISKSNMGRPYPEKCKGKLQLYRVRPVIKILNGVVVGRYQSLSEAGRAHGVKAGTIWRALSLNYTSLGFDWKYDDETRRTILKSLI